MDRSDTTKKTPSPEIGERIALARRDREFAFDANGLRIDTGRSRLRSPRIAYDDITHYATSRFGFWLGTKRRIFSIRRSRFLDPDGPERLSRALTRAIAQRPHGFDQLARMSEIHGLARRPFRQYASRSFALVCIAVYLAQLRDPFITEVGALTPLLVDVGQFYRLVSANFLHGVALVPLHLVFNVLGLVGLALLVERPLGALRTGVVMGMSGLAAMFSSYLFGYGTVMGASGIVMGLAGAALCLELHHCDRLPVWWRVPRRPFIALLLIECVTGFALPFVAGEAHFGGFVAGYLATRWVTGRGALARPHPRWLRRVAVAMAVLTGVALLNAGFLVLRESSALEHYARQLLSSPDSSVDADNSVAWRMATESRASVAQLEAAQRLAERAADRTAYQNPEILDTLAEVLFVRGDSDAALAIIDEAIRITHGEDYYVEQRRRFTGERDFDDHPPPPRPWDDFDRHLEAAFEEPGILI